MLGLAGKNALTSPPFTPRCQPRGCSTVTDPQPSLSIDVVKPYNANVFCEGRYGRRQEILSRISRVVLERLLFRLR